jgi:2-oxo-4-hydroxy-4-carboxy--5-ureidoimidazoline (OHCU) decarboxylase
MEDKLDTSQTKAEIERLLTDHNTKVMQASKKWDGYPVAKSHKELTQAVLAIVQAAEVRARLKGETIGAINVAEKLASKGTISKKIKLEVISTAIELTKQGEKL